MGLAGLHFWSRQTEGSGFNSPQVHGYMILT